MIYAVDRFVLVEAASASSHKAPGWRARKRREQPRRCDCCRCLLAVKSLTRCFICQRRRGGT